MNLTSLQTDTLFLSNTVSAQYTTTNITRNLNRYYDELVAFIWNYDNSWIFDEGETYLPIATTNLVADQYDYQLPTDARQIHRVSILNEDGDTLRLDPISDKRMPQEEEEGTPVKYQLLGRSIRLTPTPDYNKNAGVIIEMSKSVTELSAGGDEPKVEREFHRYLSLGAAKDWYLSKSNITKKRELEKDMERMRVAVKNLYTNRHQDYSPANIKRKIENYS